MATSSTVDSAVQKDNLFIPVRPYAHDRHRRSYH